MSTPSSLSFNKIHIVESVYSFSVSTLGRTRTIWVELYYIYHTHDHKELPACWLVHTMQFSNSRVWDMGNK